MVEKRAKILVVDDDPNLLNLLVDTLSTIGYVVTGAEDGAIALDKLRENEFDLMITDIKMPRLDGISLLRRVRRYYPKLPVLFITGMTTPEIIGRATADGFLAKPFRISHMEQLIENTLSGKQEKVDRPISRVMVVDDDDIFRQALTDMLQANDYVPISVESGEHALKELGNGTVDAVIVDIKMPDMDGIDLMKQIKRLYPDLPVVLVTAHFSLDDADDYDGSSISPDGFLQKPFRAENIIRMLDSLADGLDGQS